MISKSSSAAGCIGRRPVKKSQPAKNSKRSSRLYSVTTQPAKDSKNWEKITLCRPRQKYYKTEFSVCCLCIIKLWFKQNRFFKAHLKIFNSRFECRRFPACYSFIQFKISSFWIINLMALSNSWNFQIKSFNTFLDILAGVLKKLHFKKR